MAQIRIRAEILSGNLGEGWADNYKAAQALAAYTKDTWMSDLQAFIEAGHEVEITIDVQHASGCARERAVDVSGAEDEAAELEMQVEHALTDESSIWTQFCESAVGSLEEGRAI